METLSHLLLWFYHLSQHNTASTTPEVSPRNIEMIRSVVPSSKTCSGCSWINDDLTLAERVFICHDCGLVIDRDLNAAINIRKEALRLITDVPVVASSERKIACGAGSAGSAMSETFCDEAGTKVS